MKSSVEEQSTLERKLNIEVPQEQVKEAFDKAFQNIKKSATIKGYRKGKAPLEKIRTMYGEQVQQDILNDLIQQNYVKALQEHGLDPISYPKIDFTEISQDEAFKFSAIFEIHPDVKLGKLEGLKLEKEKLNIGDEAVDNVIDNIRQNRASIDPMLEDRPAQLGDIVIIDFKGVVDGQAIENGAGTDHQMELGNNGFMKEFDENLQGMKTGASKTFDVQFPEDYHGKDVAGKKALFDVTLKEIKKKTLPEINDEFAKSLGADFESVSDLKEAVKKDITTREEKRVHDELKNRAVKALVEANPLEVPRSLIDEQKQALVKDIEMKFAQQGMPMPNIDEYKQKWDADFENSATTMVKSSFLIDAIAKEKNLKAEDADIEKMIADHAASMGIDVAQVQEYYKDPSQRSRLGFQITEEKVLNYLIENAKITEVPAEALKNEK